MDFNGLGVLFMGSVMDKKDSLSEKENIFLDEYYSSRFEHNWCEWVGRYSNELNRLFFCDSSRVENREPSSEVSPLVIKELHPLYLDNARSYLSEASFGSFSERPQHLDQLVQFPVPLDGPYECLLYMGTWMN